MNTLFLFRKWDWLPTIGEPLALRACRYLKTGAFFSCRYPSFTRQFISDKIDRPDTDPRELADYCSNLSTANRGRAILLVLIYFIHSLKNLIVMYMTLKIYNYSDHASNLKPLSAGQLEELSKRLNYPPTGQRLTTITCLITNCTHLGPRMSADELRQATMGGAGNLYADRLQLAVDMAKLPHFALCKPELSVHFSAVTKLDTFGILAFLSSTYTIILLGCWTIVQQLLVPASGDLIVFITSPKVTKRLVRERAKQIMYDLINSYSNYCRSSSSEGNLAASVSRASGNGGGRLPPEVAPNESRGGKQGGKLDKQLRPLSFRPSPSVLRNAQCCDDAAAAPLRDRRNELPYRRFGQALAVLASGPHSAGAEQLAATQHQIDEFQHSDASRPPTNWLEERPSEQLERAIDNCMPVVRTDWWRLKMMRMCAYAMITSQNVILFIGVVALGYFEFKIYMKRVLLEEFQAEMERSNCYIWHEAVDRLEPRRAIQVGAALNDNWRPLPTIELMLANFAAGLSGAYLSTFFLTIINDTAVWLAEVRLLLVASVLVTRFTHHKERAEFETNDLSRRHAAPYRGADQSRADLSGYHVNTRDFFNLPNLRRQFTESTQTLQILAFRRFEPLERWSRNNSNRVATTTTTTNAINTAGDLAGTNGDGILEYNYSLLNSPLNDRYHSNQFLAQILKPQLYAGAPRRANGNRRDDDSIEYDIETMEQIYVNYRMLCEHMHGLGPSMTVLLAITYLLNYGFVFLCAYCGLQFTGFSHEPAIVILFAFGVANYLIYLTADFHANARKLQPLIWSIVAQTTYSQSQRVRHLRSLWVKQAIYLDEEGGLAFVAMGMRITHVYIIQLMIWTATILAIALKTRE